MPFVIAKGAASSKTIKFNVATFALTVVGSLPTFISGLPFVSTRKAIFITIACVFINALGNSILRFYQRQPVTLRGGQHKQVPS